MDLAYLRNEGKAVLEAQITPLVADFCRGGMSERVHSSQRQTFHGSVRSGPTALSGISTALPQRGHPHDDAILQSRPD